MIRDIAGRQLRLRYTFNSVCAIEERAGRALEHMLELRFVPVRLLFWCALTELQPEISLHDAGDMIGAHLQAGGTLTEIAQICLDALERAGFRAAQ